MSGFSFFGLIARFAREEIETAIDDLFAGQFDIKAVLIFALPPRPYDWKPTVMIGKAGALYEITVIRETLMDKAKAEELIAQSRAEGEREAEIAFQTELKELEFIYQEKLVTVQAQVQTAWTPISRSISAPI